MDTQTAVAAPRCFISALFGRAVFIQDWQSTSCVPNITTNTYAERRVVEGETCNFSFQTCQSNVLEKVCFIVDMQCCFPLLKWRERSLYSPVICSVTHNCKAPLTKDDCLERRSYFPFPRWQHSITKSNSSGCKLSNITFCVHKTKVEFVKQHPGLQFTGASAKKKKKRSNYSFIIFINSSGAIMLRYSFHGNNTCEKLKWTAIPFSS